MLSSRAWCSLRAAWIFPKARVKEENITRMPVLEKPEQGERVTTTFYTHLRDKTGVKWGVWYLKESYKARVMFRSTFLTTNTPKNCIMVRKKSKQFSLFGCSKPHEMNLEVVTDTKHDK